MPENAEHQGDELAGSWTVVSGPYKRKPFGGNTEFTFTRGSLLITSNESNEFLSWLKVPDRPPISIRYQLFPAMNPQGIDLGPVLSAGLLKLARGIYEVDKDNLRICLPSSPHSWPFKDRPSDFDRTAGRELWILRRKVEGVTDCKQPQAPAPEPAGLVRRIISMFRRRPNL